MSKNATNRLAARDGLKRPSRLKNPSRSKRSSSSTPASAAEEGRPESTEPLRDVAYKAIKHRIITCVFRPGDYLNEAYISTVLRLGRTPVHQAIDRLVLDGLVEVIPRKGVIVRPVSFDEVMQIVDTRLHIEPWGVRLAAERAVEKDIVAMEDILVRSEHATAVRDIEQMMLLDREFHVTLARATRNDVLAEILRKLHERSLRFWFISLVDAGHHGEVQVEHQAVVQAIRDRNLEAAEGAMRNHIESFRRSITHMCESGNR
jgi:GntR family transcriptional regulator, rspAB operon transcriptional repressor